MQLVLQRRLQRLVTPRRIDQKIGALGIGIDPVSYTHLDVYKRQDDYGVEEILAGRAKPAVFARLLQAPFDERLSLVSLLLAGLDTRFTASLPVSYTHLDVYKRQY